MRLDLCCGNNKPEGFFGIDRIKTPCTDLVWDLNDGIPIDKDGYWWGHIYWNCPSKIKTEELVNGRYEIPKVEINYIRAYDALEHLKDKNFIMSEIWRVCKSGAIVDIRVPSTDGRGAFQDPSHVSYWNYNSFAYYVIDSPAYLEYNQKQGFKGQFQTVELYDKEYIGNVIYTFAKLIVIK